MSHAVATASDGTTLARSTAPRCCGEYPVSSASACNVQRRLPRNVRSSAPKASSAEPAAFTGCGGRPGPRRRSASLGSDTAHPPDHLLMVASKYSRVISYEA